MDTSTIGPVISMPAFSQKFGTFSSFLEGFVVSCILIPGAVFSFLGGSLSDSLGRARAIAIGALAFSAGAAIEASALSLGMFIAGRCIVGAGQGLFLSVCVVYVCEVAPPKQRGPLTTVIQLLITIGLCLGFFTSYGTVKIPSSLSWRLPLALQSGIAFFLALASHLYLPPSPRWLAQKGRRVEASQAWNRLGVSGAEREKDLLQGGDQVFEARAEIEVLPFGKRMQANLRDFSTVFRKESRKPMFMGVFMMAAQQMSGIDGVIYYAPLLFSQAGLSSTEASFLASGVSAILIFVFTILAVFMVDRWGRRASTIGGGLVMLGCMATMAMLHATGSVHSDRGIGKWTVIVTIYVFSTGYSMTWAIGLKLFASEIQPAATRATATSIAQGANFITNFLVAFITPVILSRSSSGAYFMFGGFLLLTVGVSIVYMPETRGVDLESVSHAFSIHNPVDLPIFKVIRNVVKKIGKRTGLRPASVHSNNSGSQGIELEGRSNARVVT